MRKQSSSTTEDSGLITPDSVDATDELFEVTPELVAQVTGADKPL